MTGLGAGSVALIVHGASSSTEGTAQLFVNGVFQEAYNFRGATHEETVATDTEVFLGHSEGGYAYLQFLITGVVASPVSPRFKD